MSFPGSATAAGTVSVPPTTKLQPASAVSLEAWLQFAATPATYTFAVGYGSDSSYAPYGLFFQGERPDPRTVLHDAPACWKSARRSTFQRTRRTTSSEPTTARPGVSTSTAFKTPPGRYRARSRTTRRSSASRSATMPARSDPAFKGTIDEVAVYAGKVLTARASSESLRRRNDRAGSDADALTEPDADAGGRHRLGYVRLRPAIARATIRTRRSSDRATSARCNKSGSTTSARRWFTSRRTPTAST